jgi:excisionase family DNA binding protein
MPSTKTPPAPAAPVAPLGADAADVLTLAEAAAYLRVAEADVLQVVRSQGLPGRLIGSEWRFLKAAVQDWLRTPAPRSGKEALLAMAGVFKDDPFLEEIVREAYRQRGRPITEEGE